MLPVQTEVEQPSEVQGGGAVVKPGVVLGYAAVAELAVPTATSQAMDRSTNGRCWR